MSFVHGSTTSVLYGAYDLSSYFNQFSASRQRQAVDTTTFGNSDHTYIAGVESGSVSLQGLWDGSASAVDAVLYAAIPGESVISVAPQGFDTIGNKVVMVKVEQGDYQIRMTETDAVRITAGATADGPIRNNGVVLHDLSAETTTLNESSVNNGASSAYGGVGHIHVTAFSGTNATVKIQDSANDSDWADLISFTQITGITSEQLTVTGTVDQYLRFAITVDNFTSMTIACCFARHAR